MTTSSLSALKRNPRIQLLLFLASVSFGLILTPVLEQITSLLLGTKERLLIVLLVYFAFVILLALHVGVRFNAEHEARYEATSNKCEEIFQRLGLTVQFLSDSTTDPKRDAYTIVREFVASAEEELLILDHRPNLTTSRFYDSTPGKSDSRASYYSELTAKALSKTRNGKHFRYKRIVQVEEGPTDTWDCSTNGDIVFAQHLSKIVALRLATPQATASVKSSRVFYPKSSIVIADRKRVLIELAIVGPNGDARIEGDLVFTDYDGSLARPLEQLFEHIDNQSTLISQVKGLPAIKVSSAKRTGA